MEDIEKRVIDAVERLSAVETDNHNLHCRLTELNKKIDDISSLAESVHTMANELVRMRADVNKIDNRMTEIEAKPVKRWDLIVTTIITAVCTGAVTFLISQILG